MNHVGEVLLLELICEEITLEASQPQRQRREAIRRAKKGIGIERTSLTHIFEAILRVSLSKYLLSQVINQSHFPRNAPSNQQDHYVLDNLYSLSCSTP